MAQRSAELITQPAEEPVTLAEFKSHAKIEDDFSDDILPGFIVAARKAIEKHTKRSLITQTWSLPLDAWPEVFNGERHRIVNLPHRPIQSVDSVEVDGTAITASANWVLRQADLIVATSVITPGEDVSDGVVIEYTAGYGAAADVPEDLKLAIKMLALHYFTGRGATSPQGIYHQVIPLGVESILHSYVVMDL